MTIDHKIRDEKLQSDINKAVAKNISIIFCKIDKYEHLTGAETFSSNQRQRIEQAKFECSSLEKAFEK